MANEGRGREKVDSLLRMEMSQSGSGGGGGGGGGGDVLK